MTTNIMMPKIIHEKKNIVCRKEFLLNSTQFGTREFEIYQELKTTFPNYNFIQFSIARNPNKNSHKDLSYKDMENFIRGYASPASLEAELKDFNDAKKIASVQNGSYGRVKKWFFEKYGEEFKRVQQERERMKQEREHKKQEDKQ